MTSAPAISFDYRPSRRVAIAGMTMGAVALATFLIADVPGWIRWPGMLATAVYVGQWHWRHGSRSGVTAVLWHGDGSMTVSDAAGHERQATLAGARIFAGVVMLDLRWRGGRQYLLVARDNMPADTLRNIRVRVGAMPKVAPA